MSALDFMTDETRTIEKLHFTGEMGHDYTYTVGPNVKSITEHSARGEGDKWYYDVEFTDGHKERLFNPVQAFWSRPTNGVHPIFERILGTVRPAQTQHSDMSTFEPSDADSGL